MRRGATLVEVLVVTGLLATISVILYQIYVTALTSESRSNVTDGSYRQAFIALEQIRRELRGARLVAPALGATQPSARFRAPSRPHGVVAVEATGLPSWEPVAEISLSPEGTVRCRDRTLGHLGPQGSLVFRRATGVLLEIVVRAYAEDGRAESSHEIDYRMFLPNQE